MRHQSADTPRYQVKIVAIPDASTQQRVAQYLAAVAKHRSAEEIVQLLTHLPLVLTSRASQKTATYLRDRLQSMGATVEVETLSPETTSPATPVPAESVPVPPSPQDRGRDEEASPTPSAAPSPASAPPLSLVEEERPPSPPPLLAEHIRSLTLVGIILQAFRYYYRHFSLLYTISLVPYLLIILTASVIIGGWGLGSLVAMRTGQIDTLSLAEKLSVHAPLVLGGALLFLFFVFLLLHLGLAALIVAAATPVLSPATLRVKEALGYAVQVVFPLGGASILFLLRCLLALFPLLGSLALSLWLLPSWEISVTMVGAGGGLTLLFFLHIALQNGLYPVALVLEGLGPRQALQRSRVLMRSSSLGSGVWQKVRLLLVFLFLSVFTGVMELLSWVPPFLLSQVGESWTAVESFLELPWSSLFLFVLSTFFQILIQALPLPLLVLCLTLFYLNRVAALFPEHDFPSLQHLLSVSAPSSG
ncbi:MAG: hypothetical protein D6736_20925 [Nitrospinota bacterium]|nr:MAG: hypothetical protein D6736_20925 [Nitrospinota bacterium]